PMPFIMSYMPKPVRSRSPSMPSAGNLFGTTRTHQPEALGAAPFGLYESTSGGVISSLPGQNGQLGLKTGFPCRSSPGLKSLGLRLRSEAIITHSLVTGSLRSCGIAILLIHLYQFNFLRRAPYNCSDHRLDLCPA